MTTNEQDKEEINHAEDFCLKIDGEKQYSFYCHKESSILEVMNALTQMMQWCEETAAKHDEKTKESTEAEDAKDDSDPKQEE